MDERLRNAIWNFLLDLYLGSRTRICSVWTEVLGRRADELSGNQFSALKALREWYLRAPWNEVYDVFEHLITKYSSRDAISSGNAMLVREGSGYRFISGVLVPVTNDIELTSVEAASAHIGSFKGASQHIVQAVRHLGDRDNPDYRNAIKESISAIESAVEVATGQADFRKGVQKLGMHSQLGQALVNLYQWASDEEGIRHAMTEDSRVGIAEARCIVVTSSALVNYLLSRHAERA